MRALLTRLSAALCAFAIGVVIALSFTVRQPAGENSKAKSCNISQVNETGIAHGSSSELSASGNLPSLDYCEVMADSDRLNGKTIRMRATLSFGEHGIYFLDEQCGGRTKRTSGSLAESNYNDEFYRAIQEACGANCEPSFTAVVVGKLVKPAPEISLRAGNSPPYFEIDRAEKVFKIR